FHPHGLFRGLWRYTGARDLIALFTATTISSLAFIGFLVLAFGNGFPRSVPLIEWLCAMILVGGMRFAIRTAQNEGLWVAILSGRVATPLKLGPISVPLPGSTLWQVLHVTAPAVIASVGMPLNRVLPATASPRASSGPASAGLIVGAGVAVARELTIPEAAADVAAFVAVAATVGLATAAALVGGMVVTELLPCRLARLIAMITPMAITAIATAAMIIIRIVGSMPET
ncbi:MAG: hypothetical protein HGA19_16425, partial [Oscillochloris sp.]|nr:hypothetical protein [Oscillochloris sp.]